METKRSALTRIPITYADEKRFAVNEDTGVVTTTSTICADGADDKTINMKAYAKDGLGEESETVTVAVTVEPSNLASVEHLLFGMILLISCLILSSEISA